MAGIIFCQAYSIVRGIIMNSLNCRNESKGGVCVLAFIVKILVIVVVAEMAIHIYSIAAGSGADAADLAKSILRMLIVAAGVYFFFGPRCCGYLYSFV